MGSDIRVSRGGAWEGVGAVHPILYHHYIFYHKFMCAPVYAPHFGMFGFPSLGKI